MPRYNPVETWMVCRDCLDFRRSYEFKDDSLLDEDVNYQAAERGWELLKGFVDHEYPDREKFVSETGKRDEFSKRSCECCRSPLGGERFEFGLNLVG